MKVTLSTTYLGHQFSLTLESDLQEDLSASDAEARIAAVLRRELQRCAEISVVAKQDLKRAAEDEQARRANRSKETGPKPPAQILAAGTKDPKGRVVLDGSETVK